MVINDASSPSKMKEKEISTNFIWISALLLVLLSSCVYGKECTNIPTELSSHTTRFQLTSSSNKTLDKELHSHHDHLTPSDEWTWMDLLPRKLLNKKPSLQEKLDWAILYRTVKGVDGVGGKKNGGDFLREVSLHDVRLGPESLHGVAQQTNLEYLLLLDVDRLVWSFRKQAGFPTPGEPYGGWEGPDVELRGHFVGHYLSASALMWASTSNDILYQKMTALVNALSACQNKTGSGYLSAFPSEFFDRFESIQPIWAPYYTIHKIMAGLLDQYLYASNSQALKMVVWMAEYFGNRVKNVIRKYSIERHWRSLNEETGGMNDVLYKLYTVTGDLKHLTLAHLFDKPCFLGLLAVKADSLSGFHANTHIPIVIGAQMRYEITGDPVYREIGTFFMDIVNSSHSFATGGTSVSEFWSDPKRLADKLTTEDEESCTTYNMLKVSRNLFRWTKEMAYADYYERALTNGVLSIQRGREPGVMIYMLPQGPGQSKAFSYHKWGSKFDSFWCCYGTGIESFSKLGDSIYFEEMGKTPTLYIIQFISSSFTWKSGGITISQKIDPVSSSEPYLQLSLSISSHQPSTQTSTINLRIPFWTSSSGAKSTFNSQPLTMPSPGNFLTLTKQWNSNDKLTITLPINLRTEAIQDDRKEYASIKAILFGPYLMVGLTSKDWNIDATNSTSLSNYITPIPSSSYNSQLISLSHQPNDQKLFISNSNYSLTMNKIAISGTDDSIHATFRLIQVEKSVMLEPFDLPGCLVAHQGPNKGFEVGYVTDREHITAYDVKAVYLFNMMVPGLNGKENSVSFESTDNEGCFIASGDDETSLVLGCKENGDDAFVENASFFMEKGVREYHSISFVAKGVRRNFVLEPLLSLRDESYTAYFNVAS